MKVLKQVFSILMVLIIAFSATACGSESNISQEVTQEESTTQKSIVSEDTTYETLLFDTSFVHTLDVTIADGDWADLLANPTEKTKYKVNVTIDGETVEKVSFATKGNSSLSQVANDPDSNRYSFKINFGKHVDGQTYYGLNKMNLSNIYADATYMKDYISYEIFRQAGVEAPLTSYVWLTINGEDQGLYLAIEDISESYLDRVNEGEGVLYKPEAEALDVVDADVAQPAQGKAPMAPGGQPPQGGMPPGQGGMPNGGQMPMPPDAGSEMPSMPEGQMPGIPGDSTPPDYQTFPDDAQMPSMPQGGMQMPGGMPNGSSSANGADLKYTDDEISSYSDIFDNNETDADEEDQQQVILALKALSENEDLETYLDTEEIIRYFVAHNFVLNYDSYIGTMLHNYYLYENDGRLAMLPWDYNEGFGAFSRGAGQSTSTTLVNTGIDTPLSGATEADRPMWNWIVSNDEYLEQYHEIFSELISTYFESGKYAEDIDAVYDMIQPYVEKDPTALCTGDQFRTAVSTLKSFCELRSESIRAQLDGTLATATTAQTSESQIDASNISLNDMSTKSGGSGHMPGAIGGGTP